MLIYIVIWNVTRFATPKESEPSFLFIFFLASHLTPSLSRRASQPSLVCAAFAALTAAFQMQIISQSGVFFFSFYFAAQLGADRLWLCFSFYVLLWFLFIFLQRCFRFRLLVFPFFLFFGFLFWLRCMQNEVDVDVYARNVFLMKPFNQSSRVESSWAASACPA